MVLYVLTFQMLWESRNERKVAIVYLDVRTYRVIKET